MIARFAGKGSSNTTELTPVLVLAYARPRLLHDLLSELERLASNRRIFLCIDRCPESLGAKHALNHTTVMVAKKFLSRGRLDLRLVERTQHFGLRRNVIHALDEVFAEVDRIIVLEDDCFPSPYFLEFCDEALTRYRHNERVSSVGGTSYRLMPTASQRASVVRNFSSWGWATWRDRWETFSHSDFNPLVESGGGDLSAKLGQKNKVPKRLKKLILNFGSLDSWAVPFAAWQLSRSMFTVLAPKNSVKNVGFGADSTHTKFESWADDLAIHDLLNYQLPEPTDGLARLDTFVESASRSFRWVLFPLRHPIDSFRRAFRYVMARREYSKT